MLPPSEGVDMLLKQLAWENANTLCKDLIRPVRKTGSLQDYIKACLDASPAVVQGMAYAAAMKVQRFSAYIKKAFGGGNDDESPTCYKCGKSGHMQKECPSTRGKTSRPSPGICPRCRKGKPLEKSVQVKVH